jgi:prephenate dehydrogenase
VTSTGSLVGWRCVVAGGAGAVGGMFVRLLVDAGATVCVVDTMSSGDQTGGPQSFAQGDISAPDGRLVAMLADAEIVILAVPQDVALAAVAGVVGAMAPGALLLDTLSVKCPIVAALEVHAAELEVLSLNPMFAPSLGIDGRPVAAVVVHDGPRGRVLLELIEQSGGRVVELGADEHDALAATTQALTHAVVLAFGLALGDLDVDVGELAAVAPPPHTTLLALLARITSGAPETYWDVQAANAHAVRARGALASGLRRLADIVDEGDTEAFAGIIDELRGVLGDERDHYRDICAQIFERREPDRPTRTGATP